MKRDTPERENKVEETCKKPRQSDEGGKVIYDAYQRNVLNNEVLYGLMQEFKFGVPELVTAVVQHSHKTGMDAAACSRMSGSLCKMAMEAMEENAERELEIKKYEKDARFIELFTFPAIHVEDLPDLHRWIKYKKEVLKLANDMDENLQRKYKAYFENITEQQKISKCVFFVSYPGGPRCVACKHILMILSYKQRGGKEVFIETPLCFFCSIKYVNTVLKLKVRRQAEKKQQDICDTLSDFLNAMPKTFSQK